MSTEGIPRSPYSKIEPSNELRRESSDDCPRTLLISAFVISLIALTIAILAVVASNGGLSPTSAFYKLGNLGVIGSAVLLVITSFATLCLAVKLLKSCRETCRQVAESVPPQIVEKMHTKSGKSSESPSKKTTPSETDLKDSPKSTREVRIHYSDNGVHRVTRFFAWVTNVQESDTH